MSGKFTKSIRASEKRSKCFWSKTDPKPMHDWTSRPASKSDSLGLSSFQRTRSSRFSVHQRYDNKRLYTTFFLTEEILFWFWSSLLSVQANASLNFFHSFTAGSFHFWMPLYFLDNLISVHLYLYPTFPTKFSHFSLRTT